jgi:serine-type D-Ala-D-Ala carboxypeptidase/endopeptidase (penicillin-binding protein 4)
MTMNSLRLFPLSIAIGLTGSSFLSIQPATAQATSRNACTTQIASRIDRVINQTPGRWSILVQNQAPIGQRQNLYMREPASQLIPASNNKVFTTAAALTQLGSRFQLRTPVTANSLTSDLATLRLIGQGDPSLSTSQLRSLTKQIKDRGIKKVDLLIGDDTGFRGEPFNPFWADRHRGEGYAAPVNSLLLNENNIYDGSVPNPGNYLVGEFRKMLTNSGIQITSSTLVKRTPAPAGEVEIASVTSPPLSTLIAVTNQDSNNVYAESLLKTLGRLQDPVTADTTVSGVNAVRSILTNLGVNPNRYSMVDGSGLAERNRASAEAFVQTLQAMAQRPDADVFRRSLAVAGRSGTLTNRMTNTAAAGVVAAKTGTLRGAIGLSGYVNSPKNPLVFSILVNSGTDTATLRRAIDDTTVLLTQMQRCN